MSDSREQSGAGAFPTRDAVMGLCWTLIGSTGAYVMAVRGGFVDPLTWTPTSVTTGLLLGLIVIIATTAFAVCTGVMLAAYLNWRYDHFTAIEIREVSDE